jgi:hypothetical protein
MIFLGRNRFVQLVIRSYQSSKLKVSCTSGLKLTNRDDIVVSYPSWIMLIFRYPA